MRDQFSAEVHGVTTDSGGPYRKFRRLLKRFVVSHTIITPTVATRSNFFLILYMYVCDGSMEPKLLIGPCLAHQTNLFVKEYLKLPSFFMIVEEALNLAATIRRSIMVREIIAAEEGKAITIWAPTHTRWYSFGITIRQILAMKRAIKV